jgi:hypothetical protein
VHEIGPPFSFCVEPIFSGEIRSAQRPPEVQKLSLKS